jgi:hypothetical protein
MQFPARVTLAASCAALLFAAACSDSTGPAPQSAASLAVHFDSLAVQAAARGDSGSDGYSGRALYLSYLELPAAFGSVPAVVTVQTANGVEHWKGFEIVGVTMSNGVPSDSLYIMAAYRDPDAHTFLVAIFDNSGSQQQIGLFTNDTLVSAPMQRSGATSRSTLGGSCATPPGGLQNPLLTSLVVDECAAATFTTSLSTHFDSTADTDPALSDLSFSNASFNGERIVVSDQTGAEASRVGALLERLEQGKLR